METGFIEKKMAILFLLPTVRTKTHSKDCSAQPKEGDKYVRLCRTHTNQRGTARHIRKGAAPVGTVLERCMVYGENWSVTQTVEQNEGRS